MSTEERNTCLGNAGILLEVVLDLSLVFKAVRVAADGDDPSFIRNHFEVERE